MQIIKLHRPFFIVKAKSGWRKSPNIGERRQRVIMRGQMKGLSHIARTNTTMGSTQWTPMLWSTKNKVGAII